MFTIIMKKGLPTFIAAAIVVGAFAVGAVQVNQGTVAVSLVPTAEATWNIQTCDVTASAYAVQSGANVTISWTTQGFAQFTLNGVAVSGPNGSKTFTNIQANTTYTLEAKTADGKSNCVTSVTVTCIPVPPPTCTLTPETATIENGESVTLTWTTQNAASASLTDFGSVALSGSQSTGALTANKNYTLSVTGNDGSHIDCRSTITVKPVVVPPPTCTLTPATSAILTGESVTLTWTTQNAASASLTDFGSVALSGSQNTGALTANKQYTLTVVGVNGSTVTCQSDITVTTIPVPSCDAFTATPSTIVRGGSAVLAWATTNATRVAISGGIGDVAASGTITVAPLATTVYTLTVFGTNNQTNSCQTTVTVTDVPVPVCNTFTATPATLPVGGGAVALAWTSVNGVSASIAPAVGSVAPNGSTTVTIATSTTFTLTVTGQNNGTDSCVVNVPVQPPTPAPFTCQNNVSFSANPVRISRGDGSTLTWSTTGVTAVSFDQGITATSLSGTATVSPSSDTTYTLTATQGTTTIACPVTVTVSSGGGGGGSSSPTCELTISKKSINAGDEITLRYDSSRTTDLKLVDSFGKTLVTTYNKRSSEKSDLMDGTLKLSPKSDTTYTLTVERGSKDRTCKVSVDVKNTVVVTQIRDQQPLVSGITLDQVPYTGFEAGPILTLSFYLLLMAWALYVAYLIAIKRDIIGGYRLAGTRPVDTVSTVAPELIRPDVFVAAVRAPEVPPSATLPTNLPVGNPVVGYAAVAGTVAVAEPESADEAVTTLENYAHAKKALLSSDAIRHLMGTATKTDEQVAILNEVITEAKAKYPSEDGWVVVNEKRMRELCLVCQAKPVPSSVAPFVPAVIPEGSGSLAEAIVTGNIVAAYEMIGHRPMFALADASADLDAIYRARKTGAKVGSDLLQAETAKLTDEQVLAMIKALTSALDGVYTDEASAVKMAIMKAVKVVA